MPIPESVQIVVRQAATNHVGSIDAAVAEAVAGVMALPEWPDFQGELVTNAIRAMVCDVRHHENIKMRTAAKEFGGPAKVTVGSAVAAVCSSWYRYLIAGRTLGEIKGSELGEIAQNEFSKADGHAFNGRLCERLKKLTPADKTVKQAVKEAKINQIVRQLQKA